MTVRIDHLKRLIAEHSIDTVECGLGDLHGQLRGKRLTVGHFLRIAEHGFGMGDGIFSFDHQSAVAETQLTNPASGYPDLRVRPLLDTFRPVPWRPGAAAVLCEWLEWSWPLLEQPTKPRAAMTRSAPAMMSAGVESGDLVAFMVLWCRFCLLFPWSRALSRDSSGVRALAARGK